MMLLSLRGLILITVFVRDTKIMTNLVASTLGAELGLLHPT